MKRLLILLMLVASVANADYLLVHPEDIGSMMARLDAIKGDSPYTLHYTAPRYSWIATVTTVVLPIDDRAQSVLTPEEWASRLATIPVEFQRPLPE